MANSLLSFLQPYAVILSVANHEALANWYVSKLGFAIVQGKNYPEFNTALVFLEKNGRVSQRTGGSYANPRVYSRAHRQCATSASNDIEC